MTTNKASLNIEMPGVDFAEMAKSAIAAKITEALLGSETIIPQIVASALTSKVNERGTVSNYAYENKVPYVQWLAQDLIIGATKDALKARVDALGPFLSKEIEKQLQKNMKSIASLLTEKFIEQAKSGYGMTVNLTAEIKHRD